MVKPLPIHDFEGQDSDDQAPLYSKECNSDTTTTIPHRGRGRILLSMMNSDGTEYHAAIALPTSYLEAKAKAIDVFHAQITDSRMDVSDLVLKLRMKMSTHETTWALLCPQEWTDIVSDGDEIQLGRREVDLGPLIIFKYSNKCKYVTMLLPNTCEELKANIRSEFGLSRNVEFKLSHALGRYGSGLYVAKIPPAQWLTVIRQLAEENPSCEILIEKC